MKNTDDLMGFLEPNQFDNIPIENTQLSEDEINRIYSLTMENINCKAKPIKKRMSKKVIISLIAAIIVVSSLTVFAAGSSVGYLFNKQMNAKSDSEIEYLKKSTKETIAFSGGVDYSVEAKAVLSDQNTAQIYFDIISNGEVRKLEKIDNIKKINLYVQKENGFLEQLSSGVSIAKQQDENLLDNRAGYILSIQNGNSISKGTLVIDFEGLVHSQKYKISLNDVNLKEVLNSAPKLTEAMLKDNEVYKDEQNAKNQPKHQIRSQNLNVVLSPQFTSTTLDAIGVVDNQLQMVIKKPDSAFIIYDEILYDAPRFQLVNKKTGKALPPKYNGTSHGSWPYEVFTLQYMCYDMKDIVDTNEYELRPYSETFSRQFRESTSKWRLILPIGFDGKTKTYTVNKEANFQGQKVLLKTIELSPLSCKFTIKELGDKVNTHDTKSATIKLKSGSLLDEELQHRINLYPNHNFNSKEYQMCISFFQIIDPKEIKSFIIGDLEIPLN